MGDDMYSDYRIYRDFKNVTDYQVAKATGISRSTFSDWKSGRSSPKQEKLKKIAEYLEIPIEYLTGDPVVEHSVTLSEDETEILRLFRSLNDTGKQAAISALHGLEQSFKKEKCSSKVG